MPRKNNFLGIYFLLEHKQAKSTCKIRLLPKLYIDVNIDCHGKIVKDYLAFNCLGVCCLMLHNVYCINYYAIFLFRQYALVLISKC